MLDWRNEKCLEADCRNKRDDEHSPCCALHRHPATRSVLQDWVMRLPLREQGTLLTAVRGCDVAPKQYADHRVIETPERRLTGWIRWAFMVPADPREVGYPGAFMQNRPPEPFKPSELGHYPQHWYAHIMHALEVVAYRHPDGNVRIPAMLMYEAMVRNQHLHMETYSEMQFRLSEDRVASNTVVS